MYNYIVSYWASVNEAWWNACELNGAHSGVSAVSAFQPQPRKVLEDYVIVLLLAVLISVKKIIKIIRSRYKSGITFWYECRLMKFYNSVIGNIIDNDKTLFCCLIIVITIVIYSCCRRVILIRTCTRLREIDFVRFLWNAV